MVTHRSPATTPKCRSKLKSWRVIQCQHIKNKYLSQASSNSKMSFKAKTFACSVETYFSFPHALQRTQSVRLSLSFNIVMHTDHTDKVGPKSLALTSSKKFKFL